ncbi:hypothetical protein [Polaribacter sp. Q13]|uniref:hypothetical protein n=1 Tax=Polaribacter sp. Q13 TaxID=2806551 RepID=UPI00193BF5D2|nr:hypothetical protein [Polaribacter sp. Q13]QVY66487.1 hypothetical protein JOP69_04140 [Polaribacter sp. Q13]
MISCSSNDDDNSENFEINGEFNHTITGCDNTDNLEINCVEFIKFIDETNVSLLIDGSDIVYIGNYEIIDDKINIETTDNLNINISFIIQDGITLKRIENNDIWVKSE